MRSNRIEPAAIFLLLIIAIGFLLMYLRIKTCTAEGFSLLYCILN